MNNKPKQPLPQEDLAAHETWLSRWRGSLEFRTYVDQLMAKLGDGAGADAAQFFNDPAMKFLWNAWVSSRFATERKADAVRIIPEDSERWPDCKLRFGEIEHGYEITGAYTEGRRLGEEYKSPSGPRVDDWAAALAAVPGSVERAAKLKAGKNYSPGAAGLVIYVINSGDYGWSGSYGREEVEAALHDATSRAKDKFSEVWVLWARRLYLLWNLGQRAL